MSRQAWVPIALGFFIIGSIIPSQICRETFDRYGLALSHCPDGTIRQTAQLEVKQLRRGAEGHVYLSGTAHYTVRDADEVEHEPLGRFDAVTLTLVDAKKQATPLEVEWEWLGSVARGTLKLPEVPDGDYKLHATYENRLGKGELDVPLPLFTPARIHVITDRPLYEPGNVVKFRAVVLRARDLAPLDGRPGMWTVKDPNGEVLLEEKASAGEWGVISGSFPLDKAAQTGSWRVAWVSNDTIDEVPFTVEPFTLPRFRVEATPDKPFYGAGDTPSIKGAVLYSSGAPVANAKVEIQWQASGAWPPPVDWLATTLPKHAIVGANGRFELALPQIPADLQDTATLTARISAIDPAGDRVESSASVLLSKDGIQATAVTELGNGLVQSFNNRLFVRVTTPDGRVIAKQKIRVLRTWDPGDKGTETELDEDGVASLQIDPGAPVNIVIPAQPWRPVPKQALVTRGAAEELIAFNGASLGDQVEMDRWLAALAPCAKWVSAETETTVGLRVSAGGAIVTAGAGASALDQCTVTTLRGKRLPPGGERLYKVSFSYTDPELPSLEASIGTALDVPPGFAEQIATLASSTRDCLPQVEGALPSFLTWRVRAGAKEVELGGWAPDPIGKRGAEPAMACVTSRIGGTARIKLADPFVGDSLGMIRFTVALPERLQQSKPQPTTMLGYELVVMAAIDGVPRTTLRIAPGTVPDLRMRVTPVIAKPGETVTAQLIRGPNFVGKLPKKLELKCLKSKKQEVELGEGSKAQLVIEAATEGWCEVTGGGVRALVYVRPQAELAVTITPKQPTYRPGQRAELVIQTLLGGKGGKAAVGLFGVDDSLGQLVPLPGADSLARVRPKVETSSPAFGLLDGQALSLGRIRGANAAAATVLRVSTIPSPPELDAVVNARASSTFDPVEELTDHFYLVLAEVHAQARQWEATAPPGEKMTPPTMAKLWKQALDACHKRGERIDDAYGRTLKLSRLPPDLLSLTDPRAVIVLGTRLPEDIENWAEWVARERP